MKEMSDSALYKRNLLCPNIRNLKESVFSFLLSFITIPCGTETN